VTVEMLFKEDAAIWEQESWTDPQRLLIDGGQRQPDTFSLEQSRASTLERMTSTSRLVQMRYSSGN
jgi:hypothetical protein